MFNRAGLSRRESDVLAIIEGFLHDFKSPLQNLRVAQQMEDAEAVDASINTIDSFLTNLRVIIQDEKSNIDIIASIYHALKSSRYVLNTFNTKINIQVNNNTPYKKIIIQSRGMSLERIFLNLFKNAAEVLVHVDNPELTITVTVEDNNAVVEIHDNGCGIAPSLLPTKIFKKGVTTKQGTGHGRGLYIVKSMMDRCGGQIDVESTVNKGTSFFLRLPIYNCSNE